MTLLRPRILVGILALLIGLTLWSGHARGVRAAADPAVSIVHISFSPSEITVATGSTVTWTNNESDATPHTATADDQSWDSGILNPGDSFSLTFSAAGDYSYHCNVHPTMQGIVHVVDGGG